MPGIVYNQFNKDATGKLQFRKDVAYKDTSQLIYLRGLYIIDEVNANALVYFSSTKIVHVANVDFALNKIIFIQKLAAHPN
jgi:hypothetical protein